MTFGDSLSYIIIFYTQLETSIGAVSRLKTFSDKVEPESREGEDIVPASDWPLKGGIQIRGVSASYGVAAGAEHASDSQQLALVDLNLDIAPGEKVAICGRTGSGKSSTILLLLRLLDPLPSCNENITIDGTPLHKIDRSTLRQRIIAVPQDPVFLPDGTSFQANLDPLGLSTAAECRAVLEAVDLWASLVDPPARGGGPGLAGPLAADALSQGQKQLFSLARAILRRRIRARTRTRTRTRAGSDDSGILLLDEVSSSVDRDTDRAMQQIIKDEFAGYTIVMVSHRLDVVMDFDRVVVMDSGRIVETGPPRDLVELESSRFGELWMIGNESRGKA
ncbi:P-loop containing nucleoside triphosphate hydrolase protein [Lasiosphaeria ovina]|uniref:P-loop containing nucleoside triphosphate hydrolase protein n=1 Tax=Lasiosphaeria ovina TaxID=92902 RepID=A0AAE0KDL2_9PEZI|nr:P-loop containing nucleoside triphosphate hydrolase protein [Lasiosphaeria ovina]